MEANLYASVITLIQDYLHEGSSLKLRILSQLVGDFLDNNKFPKELHVVITPHEDSGLIRDLTWEVLHELWFYLGVKEPQYEFSRTEYLENLVTVIFKKA